jgi:hypothetical protein
VSRSRSWRRRNVCYGGIGSEGEHFGFADPISQPPIEGADTPSYPGDGVLDPDGTWRPLKPGEFLLGYEDEVGREGTQSPQPLELRLNGTYMVFRKLYQDVAAFRRYLVMAAEALYSSDDHCHQELVAAKIMGCWRSGCPIDLSPDKDDPAIAADPLRHDVIVPKQDAAALMLGSSKPLVHRRRLGSHTWRPYPARPKCCRPALRPLSGGERWRVMLPPAPFHTTKTHCGHFDG